MNQITKMHYSVEMEGIFCYYIIVLRIKSILGIFRSNDVTNIFCSIILYIFVFDEIFGILDFDAVKIDIN